MVSLQQHYRAREISLRLSLSILVCQGLILKVDEKNKTVFGFHLGLIESRKI